MRDPGKRDPEKENQMMMRSLFTRRRKNLRGQELIATSLIAIKLKTKFRREVMIVDPPAMNLLGGLPDGK